jgi:hypothetical protein
MGLSTSTAITSTSSVTPVAAGNIVTFQIVGTLSLTITFESTCDGVNWVATGAFPISESGTAATTATATGIWRVRGAGLAGVRARCSAFTSATNCFVITQSNDENNL